MKNIIASIGFSLALAMGAKPYTTPRNRSERRA